MLALGPQNDPQSSQPCKNAGIGSCFQIGLNPRTGSGTYICVWKMPKGVVGCFRLDMRLNNSTDPSTLFNLR
jgi:hypothetical protein